MDASRQWSSSSRINNNMVRIIFTVLKWIIHIPSDLNWTESERGKTVLRQFTVVTQRGHKWILF